jgi:hypothetical protein
MTREERVYIEAKKAGICARMTGKEDFEDLMRLFFTPQGLEFCSAYNLPSMAVLQPFRGMQAARGGFYIDAPVKLKNPVDIALFGTGTVAELEYDDVGTAHRVVMMHGAKAKITASSYTIVFLTNISGNVEKIVRDKALIMDVFSNEQLTISNDGQTVHR